MKFLHLADLHIGRTLNAYSLLEDQEFALSQIINYVSEHKPDAVAVAGDVYDKQSPPPDAVRVFDGFLTGLARLGVTVMILSGNHDSPERLGFASGIMDDAGVHLYGVFDGSMRTVVLNDGYGEVRFHMLPYIRPAEARRFYIDASGEKLQSAPGEYADNPDTPVSGSGPPSGGPIPDGGPPSGGPIADGGISFAATPGASFRHMRESEIESFQDAVAAVINAAGIDESVRNVLLAHQYIAMEGADPERSESEREMIGGTDRIDAASAGLLKFDYVGLGHLHGPQRAGAEHIRYAGSLLKYSFSECFHNKCALLVELHEKGRLTVEALPIIPLRDLRRVRGRLDDLLGAASGEMPGAGSVSSSGVLLGAASGAVSGILPCAASGEISGVGSVSSSGVSPVKVAGLSGGATIGAKPANEDYLHVILTDDDEVYDALGKLRAVFPNVMRLDYDNARTNAEYDFGGEAETDEMTPLSMFENFYASQNGAELNDIQLKAVVGFLDAGVPEP